MKNFFLLLLLSLSSLVFTGCFEITEEINLKSNGSGSYKMTVDLGEAMSFLSMLGDEEGEGNDMQNGVDSSLEAQVANLKSTEGISNVNSSQEDGTIIISYDFASIEALNAAAKSNDGDAFLGGGMPTSGANGQDSYSFEKKVFIRADNQDYNPEEMGADEEGAEEMMEMFLKDAKMTMIYHMPKKVKKMSNEAAELSSDKKTVTMTLDFLDIIAGEVNVGNEIRIK